jgi:hypothetical protein
MTIVIPLNPIRTPNEGDARKVMTLERPFKPIQMGKGMTLMRQFNSIRTLKRPINLTRWYARKKLLQPPRGG